MEELSNVLKEEFRSALRKAAGKEEAEQVRIAFLGKKGRVTLLLKELKGLPAEEKKKRGRELNLLKQEMEEALSAFQERADVRQTQSELEGCERFDFSIPSLTDIGSLHPVTIVRKQIEDIF